MKNKPKLVEFEDNLDIMAYLYWLVENNLAYHLDDRPTDILWDRDDLTERDILVLQVNHDRMRNINPDLWEVFDLNEDLWDRYRGL